MISFTHLQTHSFPSTSVQQHHAPKISLPSPILQDHNRGATPTSRTHVSIECGKPPKAPREPPSPIRRPLVVVVLRRPQGQRYTIKITRPLPVRAKLLPHAPPPHQRAREDAPELGYIVARRGGFARHLRVQGWEIHHQSGQEIEIVIEYLLPGGVVAIPGV